MAETLHCIYQAPFLLMIFLVCGILLAKGGRSLEQKMGTVGLQALVTTLGSTVASLLLIVSSVYLSFAFHWYYFLLVMLSLVCGVLAGAPFLFLFQVLATKIFGKDGMPTRTSWIVQSFLCYIMSTIFLFIGIYGLIRFSIILVTG